MQIKSTTAFRAYSRARAQRSAEAVRFVVRSVTKSGAPSKAHVDLRMCGAATREGAEKIKARLERLNPGRAFVVEAL